MRYLQGWLAYLVSVKMACTILRSSDVEGLAKTYLNAWKSAKVCCPRDICLSKRLLFSSEGLSHHYRIQHSRDCLHGDEEMKREKNLLSKLMAAESLNNIAILS